MSSAEQGSAGSRATPEPRAQPPLDGPTGLAPEPSLIELPLRQDPRGSLSALEEGTEVPFPIRRVFYIFGVPEGATRASHAVSEVDEVIVAVSGRFEVLTIDRSARRTFSLSRPDQGLFIPGHAWRELSSFSSGAVCLVLASKRYEESDYAPVDVDLGED